MHDETERLETIATGAYEGILVILSERRLRKPLCPEPRWLCHLQDLSIWSSFCGAITIVAASLVAWFGWVGPSAKLAFLFGLCLTLFGLITLVIGVIATVIAGRSAAFSDKQFWDDLERNVRSDCTLVEQLARFAPEDLKAAFRVLTMRRNFFLGRQKFLLGPLTKIPALAVGLFLLVPVNASEALPNWAVSLTPFIQGVSGHAYLIILALSLLYMRSRAQHVDETLLMYTTLLDAALENRTPQPVTTTSA